MLKRSIFVGFLLAFIVVVAGLFLAQQKPVELVPQNLGSLEHQSEVKVTLDPKNYLPGKPAINLFPPFVEPGHSLEGRSSHPVPPVFPTNAERSGRCVYTAQVDSKGSVESVLSLKCSDVVFEEPSRASILKTRFHPAKNENGQTVPFETEPTTIRFELLDEAGEIIPE
jgi:outer membrane biosynthesis protein TonB